MVSVKLTVGKITSNELAFTNRVYLNPVDYAKFTKGKKLDSIYIKIKEFVFTAE